MFKKLINSFTGRFILRQAQDERVSSTCGFCKSLAIAIIIMSLNNNVIGKRNPFEFGAKIFEIECISIGKFNDDFVALIKVDSQKYIVKPKSYINDYYISLINKDGLSIKDNENHETFIKIKNPSTLK